MKFLAQTLLAMLCLAAVGVVWADHHERAGTCNDAKLQMEYFCDPKNAANDTMADIGTACRNAKINVKSACDGIVDPDKEYEFEKGQ